jgi:hypothetical protein
MKILSAIQIINETLKYYTDKTGRRAIQGDGETCMYNDSFPSENHCAVGRCLLPVYQEQGFDLLGNDDAIIGLVESNELHDLDEMLQPQYRGHHIQFWGKLQTFHDDHYHWDNDGEITPDGKTYIHQMKECYDE